MTPLEIYSAELYADRTVQDWHRRRFPEDWDAIDIDLTGQCHDCWRTIYLIEATTRRNKPHQMIRNLAEDITARIVPAFLVFHVGGEVVGGRMVYPERRVYDTEPMLAEQLQRVRDYHAQSCAKRRSS